MQTPTKTDARHLLATRGIPGKWQAFAERFGDISVDDAYKLAAMPKTKAEPEGDVRLTPEWQQLYADGEVSLAADEAEAPVLGMSNFMTLDDVPELLRKRAAQQGGTRSRAPLGDGRMTMSANQFSTELWTPEVIAAAVAVLARSAPANAVTGLTLTPTQREAATVPLKEQARLYLANPNGYPFPVGAADLDAVYVLAGLEKTPEREALRMRAMARHTDIVALAVPVEQDTAANSAARRTEAKQAVAKWLALVEAMHAAHPAWTYEYAHMEAQEVYPAEFAAASAADSIAWEPKTKNEPTPTAISKETARALELIDSYLLEHPTATVMEAVQQATAMYPDVFPAGLS